MTHDGATVISGPDAPPEIGNAMPLQNIPHGLEVHNVEMNPGQGGKLVRTAGGVADRAAASHHTLRWGRVPGMAVVPQRPVTFR